MARIPIVDRADMNGEQARVYDAAKQSSGIVGGPYTAYIRRPKLFDAAQTMRTCLSSGPLSRREQQVVHLVVAIATPNEHFKAAVAKALSRRAKLQ